MTKTDLSLLLSILGVLLALGLALKVAALLTVFAAGYLAGQRWPNLLED